SAAVVVGGPRADRRLAGCSSARYHDNTRPEAMLRSPARAWEPQPCAEPFSEQRRSADRPPDEYDPKTIDRTMTTPSVTAGRLRVLGIAGSLRAGSYNRALLRAAQELAPEGMEITLFERLREIPPY